ncbi:MAG TPA: MBL fold metallo-hydrolase [Sphingomonadaceae bacterium]|nr:MBL fold metallo-hydrolase [Sphingomonadaceae bacterium]
MREVRTIPLMTGQCRHPERMTIRGGRWQPVDFPAVAMLIVHPDAGPILFDTGYDPAFLAATKPFPERLYRWATPVDLSSGQDAASQCAALGFDPADIRHLILSHFHADHIAGTHRFPNAAIHCAHAGLEDAGRGSRFARTRRGILGALIPSDFAARARFFEDATAVALPADLQPFERGADLMGDGSLLAVELPGHCPGHWGLAMHDARWGLHFLVADAAWSLDAIRRNMPPPALTTGFLGDTGRVRGTLHALHRLWRRNPEIRISPCHCAERAAEVGNGI